MNKKRYFYITPEDYATAEKNGIHRHLVYQRVNNGWDIERAITEPVSKRCLKNGLWDRWKHKAVVCRRTFSSRIHRGMTPEQAALTPKITREDVGKRQRTYTDEQLAIAKSNGISKAVLSQRINSYKWTIEKAITTPVMSRKEVAILATKAIRKKKESNSV